MEIRDLLIEKPIGKVKAIVIIVHGMQEHLFRYTDFANYLSRQGYLVVRYSLLGHGPSVAKEDRGYFGEKDGWKNLVEQLKTVVERIKHSYPGIPVVVYGHSFGSMIARAFIQEYDHLIEALVLQGPAMYNPSAYMGMTLAKILEIQKGPKGKSKLMDKVVTGGFQVGQKKGESWVAYNSKFLAEARKDPYLIPLWTIQGYYDLLALNIQMSDVREYACHNPDLSILLIGGEDDPVIGYLKGFQDTIYRLRLVGYTKIQSALFSHMKHDILHEEGYEKVYERVGAYLKAVVD